MLASKVTKKNLIKDFLSSDWFTDYTTGGGTMNVDSVNPHKMTFTMTASAQGRLIWIPVENGKTYTFSFKSMTGLYRIYKRKVGNHDANMVITQDQNAGKPDTFSFTVDESYKGFITLRLTFGSAGTFTFENLQLEVGSKTEFEPYQLVNPKATTPVKSIISPLKNYILPFDQWTIDTGVTINFIERTPTKIVMDVTTDTIYRGFRMPIDWRYFSQLLGKPVTLSVKSIQNTGYNAQLQMRFYGGSSGNVDFVNTGTGANSITKFIPSDATSAFLVYQLNKAGTFRLSIEELQLEIGVTATQFELNKVGSPVATLYPKKNLIQPFSKWTMVSEFKINSDYKITCVTLSNAIKSASINIDLEVGKTYTLSGSVSPVNGRIRMGKQDGTLIGTLGVNSSTGGSDSLTFTATTKTHILSIDNNLSGSGYLGTLVFENIQLEQGSVKTPFEPYQLSNLRSE